MEVIKNLLLNSINSIEQTTALLYQQNIQEAYREFENSISLLSQTFQLMYGNGQEKCVIVDVNQLNKVLSEAMHAMENKDTTMLSDILQYELKEMLENALQEI